ncbi:endospore germination permease [Herbivorax sp. ANBcel31]|uniref:GerAB/ArcD/ProY family transporter n=1 Tax=Herbivorax sp. ANBcel31 TaxID=3069754 RepID=UPI0027B4FD4F|nr:endospore germination permease [Herbivorax sp. ANBcel31]MDQ2086767.1 endospore germination permease [Herbivorax sp. ANBcel31]
MNQEKISGGQLISIMFWTIMGTAVLTLPILVGIHAPRDAWMAAVIFTIGGLILSLLIGSLSKMYKEKDFVTYITEVFGRFLGKSIILIFVIWMFHTTSIVIWQTSNFTKITLLPETPFFMVTIILIVPSIYAVFLGIESIARSGQFVFFLTILPFLFLFFLNTSDFNIENLLPVLDDGVFNVLRSSLAPLAWAGEIMFVLFLAPNIKNNSKITFYSMSTVLLIGIGGIITEMFFTAVFGALRQHLTHPFYTIVRYIEETAFIERYDIIFVAVNLMGNFVKMSVFFYVLVYCTSKLIGVKNYKILIIPVIAALFAILYLFIPNQVEVIQFLDGVFPFYTIPILYGIPFITFVVAKFRKIQ